MFNPSQNDVRRFFCEIHRKNFQKEILTPLETIARDWIVEHPEYDAILGNLDAALAATYSAEAKQSNPFLHLSMHLSIEEQVSIDQPVGIKAAYQALAQKLGSAHEAHHQIMDCLGHMIWTAQRNNQAPDGAAYVECVKRRSQK